MSELKWKYYNHALLPTTAPHEKVDEEVIKQGKLWRKKWGGVPLLIRWTTNFDCSEKTEWWYCIKDTPFNINLLKSDRRYKINKGKKFFYVKEINPLEFKEKIYEIQKKAFSTYPVQYRPKLIRKELYNEIEKIWKNDVVYGAFNKKNDLCAFMLLFYVNKCIYLKALKSDPECEKFQINAAIISYALESLNSKLEEGYYLCDGERNILHQTSFQEYLEKYFGFRKAYCILKIQYRFEIKILIKLLYPIRKILKNLDKIKLLNKVNSILFMEEIIKNN